MDETRSSAPGHVEPTPEAEPLDPAASPGSPAAQPPAVVPPEPTQAQSSDTSGPSGAPSAAPQDRVGQIGRDLGQRLKPVAAAAEGIAAQALNLSAKGLGRLAAMLQERRRRRDAGGE